MQVGNIGKKNIISIYFSEAWYIVFYDKWGPIMILLKIYFPIPQI